VKIPVPELPKAQVRPVGAPYDTSDYKSPLNELAKGIGEASQAVDRVAQVRERARAVNVNDALAEAERHLLPLAHGGGDKEHPSLYHEDGEGFLTTRGKRAAELSTTVLEQADRALAKVRDALPDDDQRAMFDSKVATHRLSLQRQVQQHVNEQIRVAEGASLKGRQETTLRWVASNYAGDEADIAKRVGDVTSLMQAVAPDPEAGRAEVERFEAAVATTRLEMYLAKQDWEGAEQFYARQRGKLGKEAPQYAKQIENLRTEREGEATAQRLIAANTDAVGRLDERTLWEGFNGLPNTKVRDEVKQRLASRIADSRAMWKQQTEEHYFDAYTSFIQNGQRLDQVNPKTRQWLETFAPDDWHKLVRAAEIHAEHLLVKKERAKRPQPETWGQREALAQLRSDMTEFPATFAEMSMGEFTRHYGLNEDGTSVLSPEGYKTAVGVFVELKKRDRLSLEKQREFIENEVKVHPQMSKDKKMAQAFRTVFSDDIAAHREEKKREPTRPELEKIRDGVWTTITREYLGGLIKTQKTTVRERGTRPTTGPAAAAPGPVTPPTGATPSGPEAARENRRDGPPSPSSDIPPKGMKWQVNKKTGARRLVPIE
jgi:hypothetical protein